MSLKNNPEKNEMIDINYYIKLFTRNWWLFIITVFVALVVAYGINKYSQPVYRVNTSLVINEEKNSLSDASAQLLQDIGFISSDKNFANELLVLNSSPLIQSALEKLDFRISYFQEVTFGIVEMYKASPFVVILNQDFPQPVGCKISIDILDNNKYRVSINSKKIEVFSFVSEQKVQNISDVQYQAIAPFGEFVGNDFFNFKIILNNNQDIEELKQSNFFFVINTDRDLTRSFQAALDISPSDFESTVANLSMKTRVPEKSINFLNSLTESYLNKDLIQKKHISEKTIQYINDQLNKVSESLDLAEDDLQRFRSNKQVIDISMQAEQMYNELNNLKNEKARLTVNLKYVDYIQNYFKNNTQFTDLITPSAMGIEDPTINSLVEELVGLNSEKISFIKNNQEKSPYLQKINIRIDNLRSIISENIEYIKKTTNIALDDANSRIAQLNNEIRKMPETERELLGIERVFNINNNIYTYLLEKKSEAEIAKASYQPDVEIIEPADISGGGFVSPNKKRNYILALLIGIIVPIGFLQLKDILGVTFRTVEEIENISPVPILGKIYKSSMKGEDIITNFPESYMAESFRMLLVNLKYFISNTGGGTIALTSTVSGEGKSFIAFNLANILAINNYRTVLVGFDIRKPKVYQPLTSSSNQLGITDFLSNQSTIEDIIYSTQNENFDIVIAGSTPPNPAELIESERTNDLLRYLKDSYDFVIIDTPPVGVVVDGYSIMNKTDLNIFVSRFRYTPKKEFENLINELDDKKLISSLIINGVVADRKKKYGYKYYSK